MSLAGERQKTGTKGSQRTSRLPQAETNSKPNLFQANVARMDAGNRLSLG